MIGNLPMQLEVDGRMYKIRTDYRKCLVIFEAFNDPDLSDWEKQVTMISCLYEEIPENIEEAVNKAIWFLNCGSKQEEETHGKPLYDWIQDEQMIFSAVNKVAGHEIRTDEYMHFWTFISLFHGIGESLFSTVISIRDKKNKGKRLDKVEQDFYKKNKAMIDLKKRRSKAELETMERINSMYS